MRTDLPPADRSVPGQFTAASRAVTWFTGPWGSRLAGVIVAWATGLALALSLSLSLAALFIPAPPSLLADGGTLRVANEPMGAYRVNIYTDPTPVPPDTIDVSLLVTFERGRGVATGLDIVIEARRPDGPGPGTRHRATREQATDPRFYSAKFALGEVGLWDITAHVEGPEGAGEVTFQITVQERGAFQNPYLILILAFLPLVLVGWWLKRSGTPDRPEADSENGNRPKKTPVR